MTTITERRFDLTFVLWFLIIVFGLAAWRGHARSPVAAGVMAGLATLAFVFWLVWMRLPRAQLTITPTTIAYGPPGKPRTEIERRASCMLGFTRVRVGGVRGSMQWFLAPAGDTAGSGIALFGFDHDAVRAACVEHGWRFG
jgi:hypothetical protein